MPTGVRWGCIQLFGSSYLLPAMHFPLLLTFVRQLLRWLTFGWWQLAL